MQSAFWRGIERLRAPGSDSVQCQGKTAENSGKSTSEHMEGISGVPKNVAQLKPVIDQLMQKVIAIACDQSRLTQHRISQRGPTNNGVQKPKHILNGRTGLHQEMKAFLRGLWM